MEMNIIYIKSRAANNNSMRDHADINNVINFDDAYKKHQRAIILKESKKAAKEFLKNLYAKEIEKPHKPTKIITFMKWLRK